MRKLSAHAANLFSQSGIEPVVLVKIFWNAGNGILYSDRKFEPYGFMGKLISIGTIDDIVNIDNASSSAQVSVVLDDSDGALKQIFNTTDIHKTTVQLLQWCTDLAPDEAFVIFTGEISSPIEWKESDRTLSFDVITRIEDKQVGFSVEQGAFNLFPSKLIGKAWPMVFGSVAGVPALQILDTPTAILAEPIGIVDDKVWQKEMDDLIDQYQLALKNARLAYLNGIAEAITAGRYKGEASGGFNFEGWIIQDDPQTAISHDQAADNYFAQSASYTEDANNIQAQMALKQELWDLQKSYDKVVFRINTVNMPQGTPLQFKLGSATYVGVYTNGYFFTSARLFPEDYNHKPYVNVVKSNQTAQSVKTSDIFGNAPQEVEFGQKFLWVDAGTEIHVNNFPLTSVISVGAVNVGAVWGHRRGIRTMLPANYYQITYQQFGNTICTLITLTQPLTSRTFFNGTNTIPEGWDNDQIEVDSVSIVGPNTVDIMIWIITLFTKFGIDWDSFNLVKAYLNNYPMHFAVLDKKNVINFLQELAFQARCSIWLNDGVFFLRYLPVPPTPVDTITDEDIVVNTLSITCTETENLVTSFVAKWKPNIFQQDEFKVIYQYNIPRYGLVEKSYDFYAYNIEDLVMKSAEFWMIRYSNSFKIVKFKTALHKIKLETFDAVTIDFDSGLVANGPVVGTILKATYDTKEKLIDMDVWLPVRFGEMDVFPYAEPFSVNRVYPITNDPNLKTENPFALAGILPQEQHIIEQHTPFRRRVTTLPVHGRDKPIGDFEPSPIISYGPIGTMAIDPSNIGAANRANSNNYTRYDVRPITIPQFTDPTNGTFPGVVQSVDDKAKRTYKVAVYLNGMDKDAKVVTVRLFQGQEDDQINEGSPVSVHRLVYRASDGNLATQLWMQPAQWLPKKPTS